MSREYAEKNGIVLVCPACRFRFGPFSAGDIKPFIADLYLGGEYLRTKESFAEFGLEMKEEDQ